MKLTSAALSAALALAAAGPAKAELFGLFHTQHEPVNVQASFISTKAHDTPLTPVCNSCSPVVSYAPPVVAAAPPPAPVAVASTGCETCPAPKPIAVPETCMQTRAYQVPETVYETRQQQVAYTENVTNYQTVAVQSTRVSAYYDPCSCSYQRVTVPETRYVQQAYVTPITRYYMQNYQVPVQRMRTVTVQEPVTRMRYYYPQGAAPAAVAVPQQQIAVPAQPGGAPQAQQAPGSIAMPGNGGGGADPAAPNTSNAPPNNEAMKRVPVNPGTSGYPENADKPNRKELIERIYKNNELVDERRRLIDPQEPVPNTGSPLAPVVPEGGTGGSPGAKGSSYAPPKELPPMPRGVKTASYNPTTGSGWVVLGKPIY